MGGGGAERVASTLLGSQYFSDVFDLHLLILENKIEYELPKNISVHVATELNKSSTSVQKVVQLPKMIYFVKKTKTVLKPDVSLSFLTRSNLINVITRTEKEKVVISERNNPFLVYGSNFVMKSLHRNLIKRYYPNADKIISVSNGVRNSLISYINANPSLITTVYNPYDIDEIGRLAEEEIEDEWKSIFETHSIIMSVGRLTWQKGYDILLKAISLIPSQFPVRLAIIGEGELENSLKGLAKILGIEDRVIFLGWKKNPFKYLKKSTLFVLSSRWEGFPNVLVEALACGCPAIATNCESGPSEILLDDKYGILSKPEDPEDLAKKITFLLADKERLIHYRKLAKERAIDFHKEKIAKRYIEIFGII